VGRPRQLVAGGPRGTQPCGGSCLKAWRLTSAVASCTATWLIRSLTIIQQVEQTPDGGTGDERANVGPTEWRFWKAVVDDGRREQLKQLCAKRS
jgi:hypothetical protein